MTRKIAAFFVLWTLLAAACGGDDEQASGVTSPSPRAATATPAGGEPTSTPSDASPETTEGEAGRTPDRAEEGTAAQGGQDGDGEEQPVRPAPAGGVNRPAEGVYKYALEGSRTNPFCPQGCPYREGSEATVEMDASGDVYTARTTTKDGDQQEAGSSTSRIEWRSNEVVLLQTRNETPAGSFGCTFEPPVKIQELPVQPKAWTVTWQGRQGEDCRGKTDINVVGQEDTTDATGRSWRTWKVEQRTEYTFGELSGVLTSTTWFSPDVGTAIRSEQRNQGTFTGQAGQQQQFESHTITTLKRRP